MPKRPSPPQASSCGLSRPNTNRIGLASGLINSVTWLRLAPWTRAPWRLWHSASLVVPVLLTSALLGVAVCSVPLVASSAATAALREDLIDGCRFSVGLRVEGTLANGRDLVADEQAASAEINRARQSSAALLPSVATIFGGIADVRFGGGSTFVQLISRTDAERWITVVKQIPGNGVWLADDTASQVGVTVGSTIEMQTVGQSAVPVLVKGIYQNLAREKRPWFWCSMAKSFDALSNEDRPPVAFVTPETMALLLQGATAGRPMWWEVAPSLSAWTESSAKKAYPALRSVVDTLKRDEGSIAPAINANRASVDQEGSLAHAKRARDATMAVLLPVAFGAAFVCFLLLLLVAEAWRSRRAQILVLLSQRGFGPAPLGVMAVAEFSTPIVAGLAFGWLLAVKFVPVVGPSAVVEGSVVRSSAALAAGLAILASFVVFLLMFFDLRRDVATTSDRKRRRLPWEQACVALAVAAGYEMRNRVGSTTGGRVDSLVTAFPVLLLAGAAGLLTRFVVAGIARLQGRATMVRRAWLSLAAGRLAANRSRTIPTITALAVSSGVVIFTASLASTVTATATAKSTLGLGSAQVAVLNTNDELATVQKEGLANTKVVLRASENTVVVTEKPPVDVLGIDPATFARGAYWQEEFSDTPLKELLARLMNTPADDDGQLSAIAVGDGLPNSFAIDLPTAQAAVRTKVTVVGRARFFPGLGLNSNRPLVVVPLASLARASIEGRPEVWTNRVDTDLDALVRSAGTTPERTIRASVKRSADSSYQVGALRSARAIGGCSVVASLSAIWLYFAGFGDRRRRDRTIAKMLGLSQRADVAANLAEIVPLIASGVILATALSWIALRVTLRSLDANVSTPPSPLFRFAFPTATFFAIAAVAAAVLLSVSLARATVRSDVAGALRDAD
jgi:putative ABC transport system permease protein